MQRVKHLLTLIALVLSTVLLSVFSSANALKVDFRKPADTFTLRIEYANTSPVDQTVFVAGVLGNSLNGGIASGAAFEVSEIKHTYPYQYSPARGLVAIDSGDIKTTTAQVKAVDATFVNSQNQLSFVLTPNLTNFCGKLTDVKGCAWDFDRRNQWNPDTISCLNSPAFTCEGASLNINSTNKLTSGYGGVYEITVKIKGTIEKDSLTYFPVQTYQYSPSLNPSRSQNLTPSGVSVFLTDRAVASIPTLPNPSSSSSASSSSSISSVSSSNSSSSSSTSVSSGSSSSSSSASASSTPVAQTLVSSDVSKLDVFCQDGMVNAKTSCSFTLPVNKSLPATTVISIETAAGSPCSAKGSDVTCANVVLPASAGSKAIFLTLGSQKIDTGKKVNVTPQPTPLVRTGAGDSSTLYFLLAFFGLTITALIVVNYRTIPKIKV